MPIKGKRRKGSGGARRITRPPRPQMVIPKKQLFQRLWFRLTLIGVLLAAVTVWGLLWLDERKEAQAAQAAQDEVARTGALVEGALRLVGNPLPGGIGFQVLPDLSATLAQMQTFATFEEDTGKDGSKDEPTPGPTPTPAEDQEPPKLNEGRIEEDAADWVTSLEQADERLAKISTTNTKLEKTIGSIRDALASFVDVVEQVAPALGLDKKEMTDAVTAIQTDLSAATSAFDQGMFQYQSIRQEVGLVDPTAGIPGGIPGIPGVPPQG